MGRQINFWMTDTDELGFVEKLVAEEAVWTNRALPFGAEPVVRDFAEWLPSEEERRIMVVRRSDWSKLEWEDIPKTRFPDDPNFEEWTLVGTRNSPAFEWNTCGRGEGWIARGRIYFKTDWLDGNRVRTKPEEPTRWFDRVCGWLRRRGTKWEHGGQYLMPGAADAVNCGLVEPVY